MRWTSSGSYEEQGKILPPVTEGMTLEAGEEEELLSERAVLSSLPTDFDDQDLIKGATYVPLLNR